MRVKGKDAKFLDVKTCGPFRPLINVLDYEMKARARSGLGLKPKQASVISVQDEEELWRRGILDVSSPQGLLNALFFKVGLHFALRGCTEQYQLKTSNFTLGQNESGAKTLTYREDVTKTLQGGVDHMRITPKVVTVVASDCLNEKCIVNIFERYMTFCPQNRPEALYLQPIPRPASSTWFSQQRVGINKISKMVKTMMSQIGKAAGYSNHSLRATAATRMYDCNLDNQAIASVTGHRTTAIERYKRLSDEKRTHIQTAIQGGENSSAFSMDASHTMDMSRLFSISGNTSCTFNITVNTGSNTTNQ